MTNGVITCSGVTGSFTSTFSGGTGTYAYTAIATSQANAIDAVNGISGTRYAVTGSTYNWSGIANGTWYTAVKTSTGGTSVQPTAVVVNCTTTTTTTIAPTTTTTTVAPTTTTTSTTTASARTGTLTFTSYVSGNANWTLATSNGAGLSSSFTISGWTADGYTAVKCSTFSGEEDNSSTPTTYPSSTVGTVACIGDIPLTAASTYYKRFGGVLINSVSKGNGSTFTIGDCVVTVVINNSICQAYTP